MKKLWISLVLLMIGLAGFAQTTESSGSKGSWFGLIVENGLMTELDETNLLASTYYGVVFSISDFITIPVAFKYFRGQDIVRDQFGSVVGKPTDVMGSGINAAVLIRVLENVFYKLNLGASVLACTTGKEVYTTGVSSDYLSEVDTLSPIAFGVRLQNELKLNRAISFYLNTDIGYLFTTNIVSQLNEAGVWIGGSTNDTTRYGVIYSGIGLKVNF